MKNIIFCFWLIACLITACGNALADEPTELTLAKSSNSWDGSALPPYPKGTPEVAVLQITIPPGARLPLHKHPVINAGVVLSGELTVVTETDKELHLKPGQALIELVDKWHYGRNDGDVPTVIIVFYASALNAPLTVIKD
jgi:quercetin dioxygenase-like cupin family protein